MYCITAFIPPTLTRLTFALQFPLGNRCKREQAPFSWKVFETGKPAIISDYSEWESHNEIFETYHFHAAVSIPILVGETCIGVLGFARTEPGHLFNEEDILSATRFAAIAALAMENSRLYREIEMLATTDELTGIRNRRSLLEIAEREIKRSARYRRSLSVLMLDADHFKQINDTWGHAAGDIVLKGIARQCMEQIRVTDTVGRYTQDQNSGSIIGRLGGEEFVILLPETALEPALILAERIRASIEKMDFEAPRQPQEHPSLIRVTISMDVATLNLACDSLSELLSRVDNALNTAKQTGRNCVCAG